MKEIKTVDAIGAKICHDMTQIIKGEFKDARFRRGHIIREEDIEVLLSMGKEHIYVLDEDDELENKYHEEEAAKFLFDICAGDNIKETEVKEGKIVGISNTDGLLKVNVELLNRLNSFEDISVAAKLNNTTLRKGDKLFGARIIPLYIEKTYFDEVVNTFKGEKIMKVLPFNQLRVGLVTTGSEVYKGIIEDGFKPVLEKKLGEFGSYISEQIIVSDEPEMTKKAIEELVSKNVDMVLCTGGMSVDPDDKTPLAIKMSGAKIISYGSPVLPGSMCLLSYLQTKEKQIPVLGLPGSVMFCEKTVFDIFLPRLLAKDIISREEINALGHGGLL